MCVGGGGEVGWQIIEWGGAERREACEIRRRGWCEVKIWCSEGLLASGATNSLRLQCAWRNSIYYLDIYGGFSSHGFTVCNGEFTPVVWMSVCVWVSECVWVFFHIFQQLTFPVLKFIHSTMLKSHSHYSRLTQPKYHMMLYILFSPPLHFVLSTPLCLTLNEFSFFIFYMCFPIFLSLNSPST